MYCFVSIARNVLYTRKMFLYMVYIFFHVLIHLPKRFWITTNRLERLIHAEVILFPKRKKKTASGTIVQHVKQQNQQAAQGQSQNQKEQGQFGTEFASETNVQDVKKANQKSQQNKK